jgi:hypothetical protein
MKFFTIIFNILITKSLCEPIYKYQLRHMYKNEINKYINSTVENTVDEIRTQIINNAKQNINTTYFYLFYGYSLKELEKSSQLEIFQNQNNYGKSDTQQQIKYNNCLTKQNQQYQQYSQHYNIFDYQSYDYSQLISYNIPVKLIISKILNKLRTNFPDSDIVKIVNDKSCSIDTYYIYWD